VNYKKKARFGSGFFLGKKKKLAYEFFDVDSICLPYGLL